VARNAIFRAIQDGYFDELHPKASSSSKSIGGVDSTIPALMTL
jgi:hypothetical protein